MGLDTVELVMLWEEIFDIEIENAEAEKLTSVQEAINHICGKLGAEDVTSFCPPRRALVRVKAALSKVSGVEPSKIHLQDPIFKLRGEKSERLFREEFDRAIGIEGYKTNRNWLRRSTVRSVTESLAGGYLRSLREEDEPWTRSLVRYGVRYATAYIAGYKDFRDSDGFIKEIRLD